jgi:hypothetical protein
MCVEGVLIFERSARFEEPVLGSERNCLLDNALPNCMSPLDESCIIFNERAHVHGGVNSFSFVEEWTPVKCDSDSTIEIQSMEPTEINQTSKLRSDDSPPLTTGADQTSRLSQIIERHFLLVHSSPPTRLLLTRVWWLRSPPCTL